MLLFSIFWLGCPSPTFAASPPSYCNDLFSVACSPGETKDLTGTATNGVSESFLDTAIQNDLPTTARDFKKIIQDPNQKYFRKMALETLAFKNSPECQFQDPKNIEDCDKKISEGLAQFASIKISQKSKTRSIQFNGNLEDLTLLQENSNFKNVLHGMKARLSDTLKVKELEKKVELDIFPTAKQLLQNKISSFPVDDKMKDYLVTKIKSMNYSGNDCFKDRNKRDQISIDSALITNAAYVPKGNEFLTCNGILFAGQSDFTLLWSTTHEIAHSIDPCGIQMALSGENIKYDRKNLDKAESQYINPNLLKCLRNKDSVEAKRNEGVVAAGQRRLFGSDDKMFCKDDQIGESTADWLATEVIADYINKNFENIQPDEALRAISNITKPLCPKSNQSSQPFFDMHPKTADRVNRIILAQPRIRQALGCSDFRAPAGYCDGYGSRPIRVTSGKISPAQGTR